MGNHDRPVFVNQTDPQFAWNIFRCEHCHNPVDSQGGAAVDCHDVCSRVVAELEDAVKHASHVHVIDEGSNARR